MTERRLGRDDGRKVRWLQFVKGTECNAQITAARRFVSRGMGRGKAGVQRGAIQFPREGTSTVRNMAKARAQDGEVAPLHYLRSTAISSYRLTRKHLDSKSHHNCKPIDNSPSRSGFCSCR